jgi:hypothetical protein
VKPRLARLPLLAAGMAALLWALAAGLVRIGWAVPAPHPDHLGAHGPLMIGGFLGTVIALERAVAYGRMWGYLAPALSAAGVAALALRPAAAGGPALFALASAGLLAVSLAIARRHPSLHLAAMTAGAACWLAGNALWLAGWPVFRVVAFWMAFPVLTIAGERLELTRMLPPTRYGRAAFVAVAALLLAGAVDAARDPSAPPRLFGGALALLAAWLLRNDVARRTIRGRGLARFTAACLLSGYVWLAAAGLLAAAHRGEFAGPIYDAVLHAVLVGFVFAMILGHAPIIFPAVIGGRAVFHPRAYAPLLLLQASVALRVAGDLSLAWAEGAWGRARPWGGALGTAAVLLFVLLTAASLRFTGDRPPPAA